MKELGQGPRAIQADSPATVNFKATERALGEPTVCAEFQAQAGDRDEEWEQTRQHPGRTAALSTGAGLYASGRVRGTEKTAAESARLA